MQNDPLFDRHNVTKAAIVAILSMGAAACIMYAPYLSLYLRIALAVANIGITTFAALTNIHLSSAPVVSTQNVENVNVQQAAPAPESPPAVAIPALDAMADRPAVVPRPRAVRSKT